MMRLSLFALLISLTTRCLPGVAALPPEYVGIPVFLGYTSQPAGTLKEVSDITSFRKAFGSAPASTRVGKRVDGLPDFLLDHALQLFWANGGQQAFVLSVGQFPEGQRPRAAHFTDALRKLRNPDGPNLILMPDAVRLPFVDYIAVCQATLSHAATWKQFVILDLKASERGDTDSSVATFRQAIGSQDLSYGAAYWPYVQTQLPLSDAGDRAILPPSPAVAGNMVKNDRQKGVWKAPAGMSLSSVIAPLHALSQQETEELTQHSSGVSINAIKTFAGKGILIWGARSLAGNDNEWRYIPVRRLANHLEQEARVLTAFASTQANVPATWQQIETVISNRLHTLFRAGAFQGTQPKDAYFVKVGLGETMSQADIDAGRIILLIGVAPTKPAEYVLLRLEIQAQP